MENYAKAAGLGLRRMVVMMHHQQQFFQLQLGDFQPASLCVTLDWGYIIHRVIKLSGVHRLRRSISR